jgi:septal ring factor EnvC (AmiA/AmiB activator)
MKGARKMAEDYSTEVRKETPGWVTASILLLAIVAISGFGLAWRDQTRMQDMEQDFATQLKTANQSNTQHSENIAALEQRLSKADETDTALRSDVDVVTKKLRVTQGDLTKARAEAAQMHDASNQQIEEMNNAVKTELATKATNDQLNSVSGDVSAVKTDLDGTKNDLKMARSELGTLIAKNSDEISVLRRLGERDYVEFTIADKKKPQAIGPVTIELRSVDTKKNKFTVALVVDDVRTEKRDRLVNEPIFVYPKGGHQPTEVVINSVGKDKITGYVSIPKKPLGTATAAAGD